MQYLVSSYLSLPQEPGVYLFLNSKGEVLYVGKAKQLKNRVSSYFSNPNLLTGKTKLLVEQVKKIKIILVESEVESLLLEASLIKKYSPRYNIRLTDGKAYPLIRITVKEKFPAVVTARRPQDPNSLYFGPYPSSSSMRMVLRLLRRIFPYISDINHPPKFCLYYHLNLCPCLPAFLLSSSSPSTARRLSIEGETLKAEYKKNLKHIIDFLDGGKTKKVLRDLEKERDKESKNENFEKAKKLQEQINAILLITQSSRNPFEYETNPNLYSQLRMEEMQDLKDILQNHNVDIALPKRIECYDISNTQGTYATASMVVLTNGEKDTSQYRRFKIHLKNGPNDFAMMAEVLTRRLRHTEWPFPDLFVVDGGKGQVGAAKEVLKRYFAVGNFQKSLSLIGLAKREETIITPTFEEIQLPKNAKALKLVMRVRDEAHRFAITYHRKLRSRAMFA